VHGAPEHAVGPVAQQVADVDDDGRCGIEERARRPDGYGCERGVRAWREKLETGLPCALEEERDGPVVGVGTGAYVDGGVVGGRGRDVWVVEESEGGAAGTAGVSGGEPGRTTG
jgi:hypothetical protein